MYILRRISMKLASNLVCAASSQLFFFILYASARNNPSPNRDSVVQIGKARFTVLTSHLIRMEWGSQVDAATFVFINRNLPKPDFTVSVEQGWHVIQTSAVKVLYLPTDSTFNSSNLEVSIKLNGQTKVWTPLPRKKIDLNGNLLGTIRTLDLNNGSAGYDLNCLTNSMFGDRELHCSLGLVSMEGYVVLDDSGHPQFDSAQWPWVMNRSYPSPSASACGNVKQENRIDCGYLGIQEFDCTGKGCCFDDKANTSLGYPTCFYSASSSRDLYFLGYGHDYKLALKEFTMVSGRIPVPPRYAFGVFYSRYWGYNDMGEMKIAEGYENRRIPLDVIVSDMDWHITFYNGTDSAGQRKGWTGFTWDSHLFPNPKAYLNWCKQKMLKNTLNLHPASGVQPWEKRYPEMAKAMGIDPSTQEYVPFAPADLKFTTNWLKIVIAPLEEDGIEFWWLDWQQGETWIKIPMVNPTWWLNYIFFTNPYHWNTTTPTTRPLLLHRWGGLGNHRFQVGFSGDVFPSWDSLDFQVNFTVKATNVLFGYWSHDLGGHKTPCPSPELYTRWLQFGIFSPVFRTHPSKSLDNPRRIWVYPPQYYDNMRDTMLMRAALVPYIYTYARFAYDTGLSLMRPMYYEFPEAPEAYSTMFDRQYFFGPDILVAPITTAMNPTVNMTSKQIWIPEGTYISLMTGEVVRGPKVITRQYTLWEIPVFVRAGTVIPMRTDGFAPLGSAEKIPTSLKFVIFAAKPNMSGLGYVYEDDGKSTEYQNGKYSNTTVSFANTMSTMKITIGPMRGNFTGQPKERNYQIALPNFWPADIVTVDGSALSLPRCPLMDSFEEYTLDCWTYNGRTLTLLINIITMKPITSTVTISIDYGTAATTGFNPFWYQQGFAGHTQRLIEAKRLLDDQWGIDTVHQGDYPCLLNATEIGQRLTYDSSNISQLAKEFSHCASVAVTEVQNLRHLNSSVKELIVAQLS